MQKYCNIVKNKLNFLIRNMEKNSSTFVADPKRDFVRKSELSFSKTMKFILGMGSQTLGKELMEFYDYDSKMVSVSATIEQFRDERARELATKHFMTGLTDMFTHIFEGMMNKGLLRRDDPEMLAFAYTAPISALIHLCDREPDKTDDAIAQIETFSRHFIKTYAAQDQEG